MTVNDDPGRVVSDWLHEYGAHRVPNHLDAVLRTTSTRRQRPAWSSLERWLPVDLTNRASTLAPPNLGRLLVVGLLILVVAAVTFLAVGSRQRPVPPPFGPARNGVLVYASHGDLLSYDFASGKSTAVIQGPEDDRDPRVSPDGTKILFDRMLAGPLGHQLMVSDIDGKNVVPLTAPVANVDSIAWGPDSKHVSMSSDADSVAAVRIAGLDGTLALAIAQDDASGHTAVENVQWRPDAKELIFRGWSPPSSFGLYAIRPDGTGERPILPVTSDQSTAATNPVLSPDGKTIAFTLGEETRVHLVDVDTGQERSVIVDGADGNHANLAWSPDGVRILFERVDGIESHLAVASVADGKVVPTGPAFEPESGVSAAFSPDGSKDRRLVQAGRLDLAPRPRWWSGRATPRGRRRSRQLAAHGALTESASIYARPARPRGGPAVPAPGTSVQSGLWPTASP